MSPTDPPPDGPPNVHPLDYAPRPPRGRRWLRRLTFWTLSAAVVLLCFGVGRQAVHQATVLYCQRQCLNYANTGNVVNLTAAVPGPPWAWIRLKNLTGARSNDPGTCCVYLGGMKRPDGIERLVYVYFRNIYNGPPKTLVGVGYDVLQPATITSAAVATTNTLAGEFVLGVATPTSTPVVHGAVLDPADPSHFTINVTLIDGRTSVLDGFLNNNNVLHIEQRP
jgi:hypothetical protein